MSASAGPNLYLKILLSLLGLTVLTVAVIAVALYQLRPRDQGEMSRQGPVQVGQTPQSLEKQTDVPEQRETAQSTEQQQKRVEAQARREAERQLILMKSN